MIIVKNSFAVNDNISTFDRYNFACIFITEIFDPGTKNPCSKFTADVFFQTGFAYFNFFGKVENFENIFVTFKTDSP